MSSWYTRAHGSVGSSHGGWFSRRAVLIGGLAGAVVSVAGAPAASAAAKAVPSPVDEALLLHVARTVAVLPVPFPAFGEQGPATGRATNTRLRSAVRRLSDAGRAELVDGLGTIRSVVSTGDDRETVVLKFGDLVTWDRNLSGLAAVVAVCVTTLASRFDPSSRSGAELWLDYTRRFAARMSAAGQGGR